MHASIYKNISICCQQEIRMYACMCTSMWHQLRNNVLILSNMHTSRWHACAQTQDACINMKKYFALLSFTRNTNVCMHVYVCIMHENSMAWLLYIYIYIYIHIHTNDMYIWIHSHTHIHVPHKKYEWMRVYTHVVVYVYAHVYMHGMSIHMSLNLTMCVYLCTCICMLKCVYARNTQVALNTHNVERKRIKPHFHETRPWLDAYTKKIICNWHCIFSAILHTGLRNFPDIHAYMHEEASLYMQCMRVYIYMQEETSLHVHMHTWRSRMYLQFHGLCHAPFLAACTRQRREGRWSIKAHMYVPWIVQV
jgi:hypothetical protein